MDSTELRVEYVGIDMYLVQSEKHDMYDIAGIIRLFDIDISQYVRKVYDEDDFSLEILRFYTVEEAERFLEYIKPFYLLFLIRGYE